MCPVSGCLPQPQPGFRHSSDVLQGAATNQDSGLVLTACNFSFSSLAMSPVCPQRGCLGLVHSRSNTEVLEGGTVLAHVTSCGAEHRNRPEIPVLPLKGVQVKARAGAGCLEVISRSLGSQSPGLCPSPSCEFCVPLCSTTGREQLGLFQPPAQQLTAMCGT